MTSESRTVVAWRPLALPFEHGAWSLLLEPLAVALLIAPSWRGGLLAVGTIAAFLARHPFKLALRDWTQRRRYPRTSVCERLTIGYGVVAVAAFVAAGIVIPLLAVLPLVTIQFALDLRKRGRSLAAETAGSLAPVGVAAAIAIAGGQPWEALSILLAARAITSILYVRSVLHGESRTRMLTAHAIALLVAAVLVAAGQAGIAAAIAVAILAARAIPVTTARPQTVGIRELAIGVAFALLLVVAL